MKFYGKAEAVAQQILEAFKSENLPKALAPVFIRRIDGVPCRAWSWRNQLLCVLNGTIDARGFRQWKEVGRHVKKGGRAFDILVPLMRKMTVTDPKTGTPKEIPVLYGFRTAPVFALEQTEGAETPAVDSDVTQWIESLPLIEIAKAWGLKIEAYDGRDQRPHGKFAPERFIALGVTNLSTWAHELIHAADYRLGNLKERGQHWRSETVAELGGAILLELLGLNVEADRGGCFEYVKSILRSSGFYSEILIP